MKHCGALLGLAIGDALGTTHEFEELAASPFPQLASGPLTEIVGGGRFGLCAGQVTDDTQMACCLFATLSSGSFDPNEAARRYLEWSEVAFDVGMQTSSALARVAHGESPMDEGRNVWLQSGRDAAGNGSLMRTAPIGAVLSASERERRLASLVDSAITHFDPRCRLACAAFNAAIAVAVSGAGAAKDMWSAADAEIAVAAELVAGNTRLKSSSVWCRRCKRISAWLRRAIRSSTDRSCTSITTRGLSE